MILSCPSCETRYALDTAKLGATGRRVKCARCGHVWYQSPPDEPEPQADPLSAGPPSGEDAEFAADPDGPALRSARLRAEAASAPTPRNLPAKPGGRRPRTRAAIMALAGLLILAVLAGLLVGRDQIASAWPAAGGLYRALGLEVAPPEEDGAGTAAGAGLELVDVVPQLSMTEAGRVLWVRGAVSNPTDRARALPRFRVSLLGEDGGTLDSWTFGLEQERLAPGEAATFATRRDDPDPDTRRIEVTVDGEGGEGEG
jgi:predicted Zn finger-like uncharacterized protein